AWAAARHRQTTMATLVVIGTTAAYVYSLVVTLFPEWVEDAGLAAAVYYDSATIIIGLILLGKLLEARAKAQTGSAIKALLKLAPPVAHVVRGDEEIEVPVEQ